VVRTSYTYEPFGKTGVSGQASSSTYRFTGREDDSTGGLSLYNLRARSYSPITQRFVSEDPMGFPGGPDVNLYAYARNRPTMLTDPTGLSPSGCGFLGWSCVQELFANHWNILLYAFDIAAFGLTVYGLGLIVPVVSGVVLPGLGAAAPWLIAGAVASLGGTIVTYATGGSAQDRAVVTTTFTVPALFSRSYWLALLADAYQLYYDMTHGH
jgi:RHS repeat-associated protein